MAMHAKSEAPDSTGPHTPVAAQQFDTLPAAANVALPVVMTVAGVSAATVWRHSKSGLLPKPIKIGGATRWNVGALREALAAFGKAA